EQDARDEGGRDGTHAGEQDAQTSGGWLDPRGLLHRSRPQGSDRRPPRVQKHGTATALCERARNLRMTRMGVPRDVEGAVPDRDHPVVELACDRARELAPPLQLPIAREIERALALHFPTASVRSPSPGAPRIRAGTWRSPGFDPQVLDALLAEHATRGALRIALELDALDGAAETAAQILTRAQAHLDR